MFVQAIIVLFYKKGNSKDLANYRPILLTNFDYKILAYVLTERLANTLSTCIHPVQSAYLKGKFIGTNIKKVQDTLNLIKTHPKDNVIVFFLNFRKAFDSVSYDFLLHVLDEMGYPQYLITWITLIYSKSFAMVRHKGWFTEEFMIQRGVCQGCPLSYHLFNFHKET